MAETRDQVKEQQETKDWKTVMATEGVQVHSPGGRLLKQGCHRIRCVLCSSRPQTSACIGITWRARPPAPQSFSL